MFTMVLHFQVSPEKTADVISIINSISGPMAIESSCIHFDLYSNVNNDDRLLLIEAWDSEEALEDHIRSDDFSKILAIMEMSVQPPEISFNTVSKSAGIEFIEKLRI